MFTTLGDNPLSEANAFCEAKRTIGFRRSVFDRGEDTQVIRLYLASRILQDNIYFSCRIWTTHCWWR